MAPWPAPATATRNGCLAAHRLDTPAVASPCPSAPTGAGGLFKAKAACPGLCKANSSLPRTATGRYGSWPCLPGEQQPTSAKVDFFNPEGHLPLGGCLSFLRGQNMPKRIWLWFCISSRQVMLAPTGKQKEALGRWLHTLSAAALVGAITIAFTGTSPSQLWYDSLKVAGLLIWGFFFLISGCVLSKGD